MKITKCVKMDQSFLRIKKMDQPLYPNVFPFCLIKKWTNPYILMYYKPFST